MNNCYQDYGVRNAADLSSSCSTLTVAARDRGGAVPDALLGFAGSATTRVTPDRSARPVATAPRPLPQRPAAAARSAPVRARYVSPGGTGPSMWDILGQHRDHLGVGGRPGPGPELDEPALRLAARVAGGGGRLGDGAPGRQGGDETAVDLVEVRAGRHADTARRRAPRCRNVTIRRPAR